MKRTIIILIGPKMSGKTTLARLLADDTGARKLGQHAVVDLNELRESTKKGIRDLRCFKRLIICCENVSTRTNSNALLRTMSVLKGGDVFIWKISRK